MSSIKTTRKLPEETEEAQSPRIQASEEEKKSLEEWPSDLDAYNFNIKVGEGNFAAVFVAVVKGKPTHVCAIKKLNFELLDIPIERIRNEVTTMSRCNHPNVLGLHKSFRAKEYLYMVMPFMHYGSFRDVISQREELMQENPAANLLEEEWIAIVIAEVCTGLDYIHTMGWMHRDLKAANILLNLDGEVRIADFGVVSCTAFVSFTLLVLCVFTPAVY